MNTNYHTHVEQDSESGEVCWVIWTQFPDLLKAEMIYCLFLPPGGHFLLFTQTALNVCISITAQIIFHIKPPYRNCQQHTDTLPQYTQLQSDVQMYCRFPIFPVLLLVLDLTKYTFRYTSPVSSILRPPRSPITLGRDARNLKFAPPTPHQHDQHINLNLDLVTVKGVSSNFPTSYLEGFVCSENSVCQGNTSWVSD